MLRLILLFLSVVIIFLVIQVGWPGLIPILAVATAVYAFVFLKDAPSRIPLTVLATAYVLQALLLAWGLLWTMQQIEAALTVDQEVEPVFELLAGSDGLQNFWALLGGFLFAAILFGLLLGLAMQRNRRAANVHGDQTRNKSPSATLYRVLGTIPAKWLVRDGQLITIKAAKPPRSPTTGPGEVEVQRGHALILEKEGLITDILPAGVHWVNDQERLAMVVPLYGRADRVTVRNATTSDGLQIADMEIMVFHKVLSVSAPPPVGGDIFNFNRDILQDQVWSASGATWEAGVRGITEREARNVIADYEMEDLVAMNGEERDEFKKALQDKINAITKQFMGVNVTVTGLGAINAPDLAGEKLMAVWAAAKDRESAREHATLQADIMEVNAKARAEAFNTLMGVMNDWLDRSSNLKNLVAMSFIERMERVEDEPKGGVNQDLEALSKLYVVEALKGLTAPQTTEDAKGHAQANSGGEDI